MKYVFDTSPFVRLFKNFYPSTFTHKIIKVALVKSIIDQVADD